MRYMPESERRFFTEGAVSLFYSLSAGEDVSPRLLEKTMTEAIRLGQAGGALVDENILEAIFWSICDRERSKSPESGEPDPGMPC